MNRFVFSIVTVLLAAPGAHAQTAPAPGQRLFDTVSGIVFTCSGATGFQWTGEACGKLSAEFSQRAKAAGLPFEEVLITADFKQKKMPVVASFDQDKAVRVFWNFTESKQAKGNITAALSSNRVWEPTAKEVPNAVPGQRISLNFYTQSATFNPGVTYKDAEKYLKTITDSFFKVGETRALEKRP